MQQLHFEHLGHQPQASQDRSEGMCTGKGDHSLLLSHTYLLTNALLLTTYMEEITFPILYSKEQRMNFHLTASPYDHPILSTVPSRKPHLEISRAQ